MTKGATKPAADQQSATLAQPSPANAPAPAVGRTPLALPGWCVWWLSSTCASLLPLLRKV